MVGDQIVQAAVSSNYASGVSSLIALPSVFDPRVREQGGEGHGTTTKCHENPFLTSFCIHTYFFWFLFHSRWMFVGPVSQWRV